MNIKQYVYIAALILPIFACNSPTQETTGPAENEALLADTAISYFLINNLGDTIPTGVPIKIKGKWIDPDSVAKPKAVPLRGKPKVVTVPSNMIPAGKPKVVQIPKDLTVITPGENGVPLPKTIASNSKKIAGKHPTTTPALPLKMKSTATADIQYMTVEEGLISSILQSMIEDRFGNLWFGTGAGVCRYDGNTISNFTINEEFTNH